MTAPIRRVTLDRYWLLRSLKDAIVKTTMGADYIPKCKMMSLVVVFALVRRMS